MARTVETTDKECKELIIGYTGHRHVMLTPRANKSIRVAMGICKEAFPGRKEFIVPDQGGWLTYTQYPKKLGLVVNEVKTDYGVIDIGELKKLLDIGQNAAFIYSNPAGYYAEQPSGAIYETCSKRALVIMDVSGSLGIKGMSEGEHADIMLGSFGKWKLVDFGKGGFISFRTKELYDKALSLYDEDPGLSEKDLVLLRNSLAALPERAAFLLSHCLKIKSDLKEFEIIHLERKGINVIVKFKNQEEKARIEDYCRIEGYDFTECPRYIRVYENAISIEVKKLKTEVGK